MNYDTITQSIINMAEGAAGVKITLGSMPPDDGIAITGQAAPASIMLDIGSNEAMTIVINGKNGDQKTILQQLDNIHSVLTRRKDFPSGDGWQIYAIQTVASPRLVGREQNNVHQWIYASSLLVKFNWKGI